MCEFVGEEVMSSTGGTPFDGFNAADWVRTYIAQYGSIDGDHHKAWLVDQIARIICGTPVVVRVATWACGTTEWRFRLGEPSTHYKTWAFESGHIQTGVAP